MPASRTQQLMTELTSRFDDKSKRYAGLIVPPGDGSLAVAVLQSIDCALFLIDNAPIEYLQFGIHQSSAEAKQREFVLRGYESRVVQLNLSVDVAAQRLAGRKFDFLVWDDDDWGGSEYAMGMLRPGALAALKNAGEWVLR